MKLQQLICGHPGVLIKIDKSMLNEDKDYKVLSDVIRKLMPNRVYCVISGEDYIDKSLNLAKELNEWVKLSIDSTIENIYDYQRIIIMPDKDWVYKRD